MKTKIHAAGRGNCAAGFSLVELLVVITVCAVLAGIVIPSFLAMLRSVQLGSAANDLFTGLIYARSEAIKRNTRVALCKSSNGLTCANGGDWSQGWIVFPDVNDNGGRDGGEQILRQWQAMDARIRVSGTSTVATYVSYSPTGQAKLLNGGFQSGTITLCHANASGEAKKVVISKSGRPRVEKTTVASC